MQGFCPLKIKITQFPGGFRLKICGQNVNPMQLHFKGIMLFISRDFTKRKFGRKSNSLASTSPD